MKRMPITRLGGPVNYTVRVVEFTLVREPGSTLEERPVLSQPADAVTVARAMIPDDAREHFVALYLDAQNRLIRAYPVSTGTLTASLVHPREVLGPALRLLGVASIILAHNHPSGDPEPSREDIRLTRQLRDCTQLLDLQIHDHVILGDGSGRWTSLAERGLL